MRRAFLLLLLAALPAAQAQTTAAAQVATRWNLGLKLGTGASNHYDGSINQPHPWTACTGGISGGYGFPLAGGFFNLQADALLERRGARFWQAPSANNAVLFVPLYLRTDRPSARVHFLLGGGPTLWLTSRHVPDAYTISTNAYPIEATGLVGIEVRLLPLSSYETTLALNYHVDLTSSSVHYRSGASGGRTPEYDSYGWFGATLNVYFHPAAQQ